MQGASHDVCESVSNAKIDHRDLSSSDAALLSFAKLITENAYQTSEKDVQKLRDAGWKDEQIAEAVYVIAMFAFFNRVSDAFGLQDPGYGNEGPPQNREQ